MRAPLAVRWLLAAGPLAAGLLAAGPSWADDGPAVSADGARIELRAESHRMCGGESTTAFCAVGADVDERCATHQVDYPCHRDAIDPADSDAAEKAIADTESAGGFQSLPVIALHRIVVHEMLDAQEIARARVTRTAGGLAITAAAGAKRSATIAVTRGKRRIAFARWTCESYGGDQAAITRAVVVAGVVYAELRCSTYRRWQRVPAGT